ncbi:hypothetical protein RB597_004609 [Gaeumannomyces tritici]
MDGDGNPRMALEHGLDGFGLVFPLPFRVACVVVAAVWGWAANLHYLHLMRIDVPALIRYPARASASQPPHHVSTYRLASLLSATVAAFLLLFWAVTRRKPGAVLDHDWIPMSCLFTLAVLFAVPLHRTALAVPHAGRRRLLATLRRVSVGGLAEAHNGKFGDILLADVLTSYSRVLADLYVCVCMFLRSGNSAATAPPDRACGASLAVPLLLALPYAIRLRQCLTEYLRVRRAPYKESVGWGGQHLANAAKYATAFPVIALNAAVRPGASQTSSRPLLGRAWVAAVLLNSLYSFYWDVAKDWDLTLLSARRRAAAPDQPYGLRRRLHLAPGPPAYYAAVALDLALRCTWVVRVVGPTADRASGLEGSIFALELLEVLRRWVWIFFRVETEHVRNTTTGHGLAVDDVLLGDYQGKSEEDSEED